LHLIFKFASQELMVCPRFMRLLEQGGDTAKCISLLIPRCKSGWHDQYLHT